ncbi:hypothetical protein D3C76_1503670 [compost metagenome]
MNIKCRKVFAYDVSSTIDAIANPGKKAIIVQPDFNFGRIKLGLTVDDYAGISLLHTPVCGSNIRIIQH